MLNISFLPVRKVAKNQRSQQDSEHKCGLDQPCKPFSATDQIPLSHHGAVPFAVVVDVAIQTRKASFNAIVLMVQMRHIFPPEPVTTFELPDLTILLQHYNLIFLFWGKQAPDVLQPPNRGILEKDLTHFAWGPAGVLRKHSHKHRSQVVDTTRDVLEGTCEIDKYLVSEKRRKASYCIWPMDLKKERKQIWMVSVRFSLIYVQINTEITS